MNRKTILIIVGVAIVLCVGCLAVIGVAVAGGFLLTQPAASVGDTFMNALKDGNYKAAYDLCDPSLQKELRTVGNFETLIKNAGAVPTQWNFTSRNVSGDQAHLEGDATFVGKRAGTVRLVLIKAGNNWQVNGFNLTPR